MHVCVCVCMILTPLGCIIVVSSSQGVQPLLTPFELSYTVAQLLFDLLFYTHNNWHNRHIHIISCKVSRDIYSNRAVTLIQQSSMY